MLASVRAAACTTALAAFGLATSPAAPGSSDLRLASGAPFPAPAALSVPHLTAAASLLCRGGSTLATLGSQPGRLTRPARGGAMRSPAIATTSTATATRLKTTSSACPMAPLAPATERVTLQTSRVAGSQPRTCSAAKAQTRAAPTWCSILRPHASMPPRSSATLTTALRTMG